MIEFVSENDYNEVYSLWQNVFGDSVPEIKNTLSKSKAKTLVYKQDGSVLGMLSLIPVFLEGVRGFYIYALATHPLYRNRKIAASLLDFSKDLLGKNEFLILVPSQKSLFDFYKAHEFKPIFCTCQINGFKLPSVLSEIEKITPEELFSLRKSFFENFDFFSWDTNVLNAMYDMYDGMFFKIGADGAFAICEKFENYLNVKELCCRREEIHYCISSLCINSGTKLFSATYPTPSKFPNAMIYGKIPYRPYFNLALD